MKLFYLLIYCSSPYQECKISNFKVLIHLVHGCPLISYERKRVSGQKRDSIQNFKYPKYVNFEGRLLVSLFYIEGCRFKYHRTQMGTKVGGTERETRDHLNWPKGGSCSSAWTAVSGLQCRCSVVRTSHDYRDAKRMGWHHFFSLPILIVSNQCEKK